MSKTSEATILNKLSDKELTALVARISAPSFKYFMKRIAKFIKENSHQKMTVNCIVNVCLLSIASSDANVFRWIQEFTRAHSGEEIPIETIKAAFTRNLYHQLDIKLQ